jgi:predicted DNA-binding transcriptional regulator AlpA
MTAAERQLERERRAAELPTNYPAPSNIVARQLGIVTTALTEALAALKALEVVARTGGIGTAAPVPSPEPVPVPVATTETPEPLESSTPAPSGPRMLSAPEVAAKYGVTIRTLWRWEEAGFMPRGKRISRNTVRWNEETIDAHLKTLA